MLQLGIKSLFSLTETCKLSVDAGKLRAQSLFHLFDGEVDHLGSQNRFEQTAQQALFEFIASNEQRIRADRIPALVMKRAAVTVRAVPSTTTNKGNTSAALRTLQQPGEQVTPGLRSAPCSHSLPCHTTA